jgi:hypothetical protein
LLLEGVFLATCVFGTVLEARYCIKSPISLARPYTLREVGTEVPWTQINNIIIIIIIIIIRFFIILVMTTDRLKKSEAGVDKLETACGVDAEDEGEGQPMV